MIDETRASSDSLELDELEAQHDPEWKHEPDRLSSEEKHSIEDESENNSAGDALLGTTTDASEEKIVRRRTWRSWFSIGNILIAVLGILFLLMVLAQVFGFKLSHEKDPPQSQTIILDVQRTGFRRPPSDYVLDPNWNYEAWRTTRKYHWTITDEEVNPDGVFRQMILIDGQFPGPLVECNEGDTLSIEIENQSVNATSFHWHGIYQNGTNWMDGSVGVTSCPIPPGGKFTYEFTIKGQSGTYWYHSHHGLQAADGLFGPLIVHSKKEKDYQKIEYATDRVMMIQDYYHDLSGLLMPQYLANDRENSEPVPDGSLINGQNIRNCDMTPNRRCDNSTASLPVIDLAPNQNHRIRIINTGVLAEFQIEIDEHQFAITEVDGTDVLPSYIHRLIINPAQRYSIVVNTNLTSKSYWMKTRMATDCWTKDEHWNHNLVAGTNAIIRYRDEKDSSSVSVVVEDPTSKDWGEAILQQCKDLNTTELIPVESISAPKEADHFFYMYSNFKIGAWRLSRGYFNQSSFRPNISSPILNRFIDGYQSGDESFVQPEITSMMNTKAFDKGKEMVLQIDGIKTIDIVIQNINEGNHPMHLHGYKYWVLGQGHGWFHKEKFLAENTIDYDNLLRRDTASAEGYGWLWIRLMTDNPGAWAFHCHISWHTEAGMQMHLLTRPDVVSSWEIPPANLDLCAAEGIEKGAGPDDSIYAGNFG